MRDGATSRISLARTLTLAGGLLVVLASVSSLLIVGSMLGVGAFDVGVFEFTPRMSQVPMLLVAGLALLWSGAAGVVLLHASRRIRRASSASELRSGGILALAGGAMGAVAMGGFLLGSLLGIAGGLLVLTSDEVDGAGRDPGVAEPR